MAEIRSVFPEDVVLDSLRIQILEDPYDSFPRLLWADRLVDLGLDSTCLLVPPSYCTSGTHDKGLFRSVDMGLEEFIVHGRDLFSTHPILEVRITDRSPHPPDDYLEDSWVWMVNLPHEDWSWKNVTWSIPDGNLWRCLWKLGNKETGDGKKNTQGLVYCRDIPRGMSLLSRACGMHGRSLAGLPALNPGEYTI